MEGNKGGLGVKNGDLGVNEWKSCPPPAPLTLVLRPRSLVGLLDADHVALAAGIIEKIVKNVKL